MKIWLEPKDKTINLKKIPVNVRCYYDPDTDKNRGFIITDNVIHIKRMKESLLTRIMKYIGIK